MINGLNLYMYCGNNPIMNVDETGYGFWDDLWSVVKWVAVGVVAVVAVAAIVAGTVVTGGALGAVLVGAGIGALAGMGGSIIVQGTTKGWNNIDPLQVLGAGAIGAVVGAVTGIASYAVGALLQTAGSIFGYGLSQSVIAGTKVAKVFSVSFLMSTFGVIGKVVGGFVGGTITNFFANEFLGEKYDFETTVKEGFWGEVPNWIIDIFKWLLK